VKTPLIIALAATLVGCSHQPPQQAAAESCPDKNRVACFNRTAFGRPIELASFKANLPTKETKFTIAAKTESPPPHQARHAAHLATKKAKPAAIAAKTGQKPTRIPLRAQQEPKSNAGAGSGTIGSTIAASHPALGPVANSNYQTTQDAVAAATGIAERMTVATASAPRNDGEPIAVASNKTDQLVAVVMVRPEVGSVSDLTGKDIAIDERYSASSADVRIAIVAAGGPVVQLSAGRAAAIDRLVDGEVPAAVVALVSADAAEGFPEIAGFKIFRIPLSPIFLRARP
jgi:hypothetical protein